MLEARKQARLALDQDPDQLGLYDAPLKPKSAAPKAPELLRLPPRYPWEPPPERVLFIDEAASRLGMSSAQLEALIDAGKVEALQGEFVRVIPDVNVVVLPGRTPSGEGVLVVSRLPCGS